MQEDQNNKDQHKYDNGFSDTNIEEPEVQNEFSKVASSPKKNFVLTSLFVLGSLVFLYFILSNIFNSNKEKEEVVVPMPVAITKPDAHLTEDIAVPALPTVPKLVTPELPKIKVPTSLNVDNVLEKKQEPKITNFDKESEKKPEDVTVPKVTKIPNIIPPGNTSKLSIPQTTPSDLLAESEAKKARKETKRKSGIVQLGGTPQLTQAQIEEQANFIKRGDLEYLLARGKVVNVVIETAVNTDFNGEIRALVSRDVYSESGKTILIPRGSKIFGRSTSLTDGAYGRVIINWERIDIAGSNYAVNISSPAIDNLGREGIQGRVDEKYPEKIANAVLLSAFNISTAYLLDKIVTPPTQANAAQQTYDMSNSLITNALAINQGASTAAVKIASICGSSRNLITDKSSNAYVTINAKCVEIETGTGGASAEDRLSALINTIATAATSLSKDNVKSNIVTQAQQASRDAFKDITEKLKGLIPDQELKRTISLDQGQHIKIYVNKDYVFPKKVFNKSKLIR